MNVVLIGATGLVGSSVLTNLVKSSAVKSITTLSRSTPKTESEKLTASTSSNTEDWWNADHFKGIDTGISSFGTTKANAGSAEEFVRIDKGTNVDFAKACKKNGVKTFVLVSSMGSDASSRLLYLRTKGEIEKEVIDLGFDKTIILRPGILLGDRAKQRGPLTRFFEIITDKVQSTPLNALFSGVYTEKLGQVIVNLLENDPKDGVTIYGPSELVSLTKNIQ